MFSWIPAGAFIIALVGLLAWIETVTPNDDHRDEDDE